MMNTIIRPLILIQFLFIIGCNAPVDKKETTRPVTPESLGISSQAILNFIETAEEERKDDLHSFRLLRHGKVAAQGWWDPYNPESPHMLYSLSKSFTSTAIGLAQAEGLLNIDDAIISFFPDDTPRDPSDNLKAMRISDLLKMNTGHQEDATARMQQDKESWVRGFLSLPVEHKPGTHFVYNSAATFMLSALIQQVTGETLLQYLTPRLFEPLDIRNPTWESNMNGINVGGWGLKVRTADIANFGQLYLQEGKWNGVQLIPAEWVMEATSFQTSNGSNPHSDWEQGYGYQFWRCRHNLYRGDGAFGQYCIVMPEQDAVMAITSGTSDMQAIMNLVWDIILPAMQDEPLEEDKIMYAALQKKLSNLTLSVVDGEKSSPLARSVSGKKILFTANDQDLKDMVCDFSENEGSLTLVRENASSILPFGIGTLIKSSLNLPMGAGQPVSSSGAWITDDSFLIRIYLYETPYYINYKVTFNAGEVTVDESMNVSFGRSEVPQLKGTIAR
jgi:CubicO group peptidase (beta-lactamase class C family)